MVPAAVGYEERSRRLQLCPSGATVAAAEQPGPVGAASRLSAAIPDLATFGTDALARPGPPGRGHTALTRSCACRLPDAEPGAMGRPALALALLLCAALAAAQPSSVGVPTPAAAPSDLGAPRAPAACEWFLAGGQRSGGGPAATD